MVKDVHILLLIILCSQRNLENTAKKSHLDAYISLSKSIFLEVWSCQFPRVCPPQHRLLRMKVLHLLHLVGPLPSIWYGGKNFIIVFNCDSSPECLGWRLYLVPYLLVHFSESTNGHNSGAKEEQGLWFRYQAPFRMPINHCINTGQIRGVRRKSVSKGGDNISSRSEEVKN